MGCETTDRSAERAFTRESARRKLVTALCQSGRGAAVCLSTFCMPESRFYQKSCTKAVRLARLPSRAAIIAQASWPAV